MPYNVLREFEVNNVKKVKSIRLHERDLQQLKSVAKEEATTEQAIIDKALGSHFANRRIQRLNDISENGPDDRLMKVWMGLSEEMQTIVIDCLSAPTQDNKDYLRSLPIDDEDLAAMRIWVSNVRKMQHGWRTRFAEVRFENPVAVTWTFSRLPLSMQNQARSRKRTL